jgi:hypothetical protein
MHALNSVSYSIITAAFLVIALLFLIMAITKTTTIPPQQTAFAYRTDQDENRPVMVNITFSNDFVMTSGSVNGQTQTITVHAYLRDPHPDSYLTDDSKPFAHEPITVFMEGYNLTKVAHLAGKQETNSTGDYVLTVPLSNKLVTKANLGTITVKVIVGTDPKNMQTATRKFDINL